MVPRSSRCHSCLPLLALLKVNGSQRYHCFPVLERKLWDVQKLYVWPPGWTRVLRICLIPNYFWIELKPGQAGPDFAWSPVLQGLAFWNNYDTVHFYISSAMVSHSKPSWYLSLHCWDMRYTDHLQGISGEKCLTSFLSYKENHKALKDKLVHREVRPWLPGIGVNQPKMVSCLSDMPFLYCANIWNRTSSTNLYHPPASGQQPWHANSGMAHGGKA